MVVEEMIEACREWCYGRSGVSTRRTWRLSCVPQSNRGPVDPQGCPSLGPVSVQAKTEEYCGCRLLLDCTVLLDTIDHDRDVINEHGRRGEFSR